MQSPETITVLLDGNKSADLSVEEFHPYEPAAYVVDPGWTCYDLNTDTEYFVSTSGDVFVQPENRSVGVAPAIRAEADRIETLFPKGD
jgi:hypothetical protein